MEQYKKELGVLLPVASLPSPWGVGDLGEEAYRLSDLLAKFGFGIWQILPLNPLGFGNSPYQPYSSFAGDEIYISLERLVSDGLLMEQELPERAMAGSCRIDYAKARERKLPCLLKAFDRFRPEGNGDYADFASWPWVRQYGIYKAFAKENEGKCWNQWPDWQKFWPERQEGDLEPYREEIDRQIFFQYLFYRQWKELKEYANKKGLRIMGDVPFYVGLDSQDVWGGKANFLLDEEGRPSYIAGVPPDYFSATGQRWGNPIYDWEYQREHQYSFWSERIGYNGRLYDILRVDHFRAFDTFWKIPASCPTAVEGEWVEAPGYEVLNRILGDHPRLTLVAEDLGLLRPQVYDLRDHYGFPGMKILQFTIDVSGKRAVDRMQNSENLIVYTGTHDNASIREWYEGLSVSGRRKVRRFLKEQGCTWKSPSERLLEYALRCPARFVILPAADILGQGSEGRINTPGTVGSPNWEWRLKSLDELKKRLAALKRGGKI